MVVTGAAVVEVVVKTSLATTWSDIAGKAVSAGEESDPPHPATNPITVSNIITRIRPAAVADRGKKTGSSSPNSRVRNRTTRWRYLP